MIFENITRTSIRPANATDSHFSYLNTSARPDASQIREVMEDWVLHYPNKEHPAVLVKLGQSNNLNFLSAFFELYLYTLMVKLGATKIDIEPNIPLIKHVLIFKLIFLQMKVFILKHERNIAAVNLIRKAKTLRVEVGELFPSIKTMSFDEILNK